MKKKVIDLSDRRKQIICNSVEMGCSGCPLDAGELCLKDLNIKKEINFYKRYIARLEKLGNKEIEMKISKSR